MRRRPAPGQAADQTGRTFPNAWYAAARSQRRRAPLRTQLRPYFGGLVGERAGVVRDDQVGPFRRQVRQLVVPVAGVVLTVLVAAGPVFAGGRAGFVVRRAESIGTTPGGVRWGDPLTVRRARPQRHRVDRPILVRRAVFFPAE